jgi:beta-galactosidase GanA
VVLTDFEQRAALEIYPHIQSSLTVLPETFEAFHRLGIGVDSMNLRAAAEPSHLKKYSLVWIPAATALDNAEVVAALQDFAQGGGVIVITPFTAYTDENGIFRGDGFAANLRELAGGLVRTIRWMGSNSALSVEWKGGGGAVVAPVPQNAGPAHAALKGGATSAAAIPKGGATSAGAALKGGAAPTGFSSVGLDGYCEFLEVDSVAVTIARFKCDQPILDGRPAATQRDLGHGRVVKLAFWPGDDHLLRLIRQLAPQRETLLAAPVAKGVLAVPRADKSLFVVNTTGHEMPIQLARGTQDRLTATRLSPPVKLKPFQVLWLE